MKPDRDVIVDSVTNDSTRLQPSTDAPGLDKTFHAKPTTPGKSESIPGLFATRGDKVPGPDYFLG